MTFYWMPSNWAKPQSITYFDRGALSRLWKRSAALSSTSLLKLTKLPIYLDVVHLGELAVGDVSYLRRELDFLLALEGLVLLAPYEQRLRSEIRNTGKVLVFEDPKKELKAFRDNPSKIATAKQWVEKSRRNYYSLHMQAHEAICQSWAPKEKGSKNFGETFSQESYQRHLKFMSSRLGVLLESEDRIPSAWNLVHCGTYTIMARYVRGTPPKCIDSHDQQDAYHYSAACYANTYVTNDGPAKLIAESIPGNKLAVFSFDEWFKKFQDG